MFGHQTRLDGVWSPDIYGLSRPLESHFHLFEFNELIQMIITGAQPKAGTGHKMQSVPVVFASYIVRDISLTFGSARWLIEILSAILLHPCPIHPHCNDPLKANSVRSIRTDRQVLLRSVE